jgi:hypothetical protein
LDILLMDHDRRSTHPRGQQGRNSRKTTGAKRDVWPKSMDQGGGLPETGYYESGINGVSPCHVASQATRMYRCKAQTGGSNHCTFGTAGG